MRSYRFSIIGILLLLSSCSNDGSLSNKTSINKEENVVTIQSDGDINNEYENAIEVTELSEVSVYGEIFSIDELVDFECNQTLIDEYSKRFVNEIAYFDNFESIKSLYANGCYLMTLFSTDNILGSTYNISECSYFDKYYGNSNEDFNRYFETRYKYSSFYQLYLNVFTEDMVIDLFNHYPFFYNYNDSLWTMETTLSGDISIVHKEYEIVESSSDIIRIQRKKYHVGEGEKIEFIPENINKYTVDYDYFTFLKTDNGWRISECPITSRW